MLTRPRAAALVVGLLAVALAPSPAAVATGEAPGEVTVTDVPCSGAAQDDDNPVRAELDSLPLLAMQVEEVQDRYATGEGVGVAVIDSGVSADTSYLPEVQLGEPQIGGRGRPAVEHGTIVAGLIAGRRPGEDGEGGEGRGMGVAPDADIYSVRVLDELDTEASVVPEDEFDPDAVVAGLDWVAREADQGQRIRIVNLSLTMSPSRELAQAVRRVQRAGVIVVAATGNRDQEADPAPEGDFEPRAPDAPRFPAAYDGVVGVGSYVQRELGPSQELVLSSEVVDVAAPSFGGVSVVPNGSTCVLDGVATSWSTAYVSGVLALLADYYGDETNEQLVARLVETASGVPDAPSPFTGAGVVQPLEAMTRELAPSRSGELQITEQVEDSGVAPEPPVREDELATARDDFRWWGLLAGAVLVAAVIVRPLLRRIRGT